ncbi:hypothetical protein BGX38DRAFT_1138889 [Terfezia claveryi]|nr:hypothetical protein BGX38DRAFT_1138889 [Terfezia claveryi]
MATINRKRGIKPASAGRAAGRKGIPPPKETSTEAAEADNTMATFLPFCPHCEKQIIVPNSTILYCSEKCRKQDQKRPTSINLASTSCPSLNNLITPPLSSSHMNQMSYFEGAPMKNYVTPSSPTPQRSTPFFGGMGEIVPLPPVGDLSSTTASGPRPSTLQRSFSSGGYSPTDSTPSSPSATYSNIYNPARGRPNHYQTFTSGSGDSSPTSPGTPYSNTYQRPRPQLHRHSTYSASSKSIDLVTPINTEPEPAPAPTAALQSPPASPTCTELLYESSWVIPKSKMDGSSIKTMFNFEKIRGSSPTVTPVGLARVTATGMYNYNPYAAYRSTQMPIREDAYMQGITTVLRN